MEPHSFVAEATNDFAPPCGTTFSVVAADILSFIIGHFTIPSRNVRTCDDYELARRFTSGVLIARVAIEVLEVYGKRAAKGLGWIVKQNGFLVLAPVTIP